MNALVSPSFHYNPALGHCHFRSPREETEAWGSGAALRASSAVSVPSICSSPNAIVSMTRTVSREAWVMFSQNEKDGQYLVK